MNVDIDIYALAENIDPRCKEETNVKLSLIEWASNMACIDLVLETARSGPNLDRLRLTKMKIENQFT